MEGSDTSRSSPAVLGEEQARRMLQGINEVIRAGEEMRALRAELVLVFAGYGWTQEKIAHLTGMSQPAVSKHLARHAPGEVPGVTGTALEQGDVPWLQGRLWALAEEISLACHGRAGCTRGVHALARGRKRFTAENVDELRRLVEEDLRLQQGELPGSYRRTYDEISRGLDLPDRSAPAPGSASVRRALARQVQRDWFRGEG